MMIKLVLAGTLCAAMGLAQSSAAPSNRLLPPATTTVEEVASKATPVNRNNLYTGAERPVAGRTLYRWSVAAAIGANIADAAVSWQQPEANPVLGGRAGQFGASSLALKSGFVATSLVLQHVALRHRPDLYKRMAWLNFATSGALGAVAAHNLSIP